MKLTLKTLAVALAAITLSPAALADTAKDGTVHITGLIQQNACTVKTDSVLIEVTLQNEFASLFTAAGQTAGDKGFTIDLENCDANIYSNVQARFEGTLDGTDATILKNDSDAQNIGVQILDKTGDSAPVTFNDLHRAPYRRGGDDTLNAFHRPLYRHRGSRWVGKCRCKRNILSAI